MINPWLTFSLILLGIWLVIFLFIPKSRKEMLWVSFFTMPFGLTEPLFVPSYWNPPSLFNLAAKTGFDIESLIFSFAIGGISTVIYETIVSVRHKKAISDKHRLHLIAIFSPVILFLILFLFTKLNPIYSASISMLIGSLAAVLCRYDLKKKVFFGGLMFLLLYFIFFLFFNLIYPGIVQKIWNLQAISGILLLGVPLEELMFAFTFGMLWSSVYEHILGYKIREVK